MILFHVFVSVAPIVSYQCICSQLLTLCASIDDREQDGKTLSLCAIITRISACDVEGPFNFVCPQRREFSKQSNVEYSSLFVEPCFGCKRFEHVNNFTVSSVRLCKFPQTCKNAYGMGFKVGKWLDRLKIVTSHLGCY